MIKRIALLLLIVLGSSVFSQQLKKSEITNSGIYYYGEGMAQSYNEAKDHALKELTSRIAIHVAGSFERKVTEGKELIESVESIIQTHTTATLRNLNFLQPEKIKEGFKAFCYLKKTEVEKIFNERKSLIADMVREADSYTSQYNVAHALKLYYFAAILLNSLPDEKVEWQDVNYTIEIPKKINSTLDKIRFSFRDDNKINDKERQVTLHVKYLEQPVSMIDFTFWDGANEVSVEGRDGLATLWLIGASVQFNELKVNVKYSYYERRNEFNVVTTLWNVVNKPQFKNQYKLKLEKKDDDKIEKQEFLTAKQETADVKKIMDRASGYDLTCHYEGQKEIPKHIAQQILQFIQLLDTDDVIKVDDLYAADAFLSAKIKNYIQYNRPQVLEKKLIVALDTTSTGWECRRIRVLHNYPSIPKQSTDYLVLDFDQSGTLVDINTSISEFLYQRFVKQAEFGKDWSNRQEIIKFLEKYRTAYLTRDMQTVELMFAEDALIIIGRKIQKKQQPEYMAPKYQPFGNQPGYDYVRLSKGQYLQRLQRLFNQVQDIFLGFSSFEINRKNNLPSIYGVEMRQSYASTSYGDEGYLFLAVDFSEKDPIIHVRAWQPHEWNEDNKIKLMNFKFYK